MTRIADPNNVGYPQNLWPPVLELPNGKWLGQTGVIVDYLSSKLGLAGYAKDDANLDEDEKEFLRAKSLQLFLTVLDMVVEVSVACFGRVVEALLRESPLQVHNVHHPVSINFYYDDQKAEALRAAEQFRASRLPKFFNHLQAVLETNPANKDGKGNVFSLKAVLEAVANVVNEGPFLLSNLTTAADLALFHNLTGLEYMFPKRLKSLQASGS